MILPTVSNDEAQRLFPKGFKVAEVPSGKPYMRLTPQPEGTELCNGLTHSFCRAVLLHVVLAL